MDGYILILLLCVIIVCALSLHRKWRVAAPVLAHIRKTYFIGANGARSKLESRIIRQIEDITGEKFEQAHPSWLTDEGANVPLELDGYNAKLKIAVEVQGPHHWKPNPGEEYDKYLARVKRDERKKKVCDERGIRLIVIDYRISDANMRDYIRSRLYDIGYVPKGATAGVKPENYIKEAIPKPWIRGMA